MEQRKVGKVERAEIKGKKAADETEPMPRKVPHMDEVEVLGEQSKTHHKKISVHEPEQSRGN